MVNCAKEVKGLYKKVAKYYAKEYWGKASPYDKPIEKFAKLLPKDAKILDAGCGVGDSVEYFLKLGFKAEGIDISPDMLAVAKREVPKGKFKLTDLRNLKYPSQTFDAIFCLAALLHVPKAQISKVLGGFKRVLKFNSLLLFDMPHGKGERLVYYPLIKQYFKTSFYLLRELKPLLKKFDFDIIYHIFVPRTFKTQAKYNRLLIIARKNV